MISALSVNPSKPTSPIYLLPRFSEDSIGNNEDWRVPIEVPSQLWLIHASNAYEERDDRGNLNIQIHATACSYQWFNFHKMFGNNFNHFSLLLFLWGNYICCMVGKVEFKYILILLFFFLNNYIMYHSFIYITSYIINFVVEGKNRIFHHSNTYC